MTGIGATGIYKAPPVATGNKNILARVGAGEECAAIVTGVSPSGLVNLRVFPDQQNEFSLRGIGTGGAVDEEVIGVFTGAGTQPVQRGKGHDAREDERDAREDKRDAQHHRGR